MFRAATGGGGGGHPPDPVWAWLAGLGCGCYAPLLTAEGFDLATLATVTPADLTAAGVSAPQHRRRIMAALPQLQLQLGAGGAGPQLGAGDLASWLRHLRLEEHQAGLAAQGYTSVAQVARLAVEDLEEVGITKLGHQRRLLLAIKEVRAGQPRPGPAAEAAARMPEPMVPLPSTPYLSTLAPYLDSLALSSKVAPAPSQHLALNNSLPKTFQSLPPKAKPVAKVAATARLRRSSSSDTDSLAPDWSNAATFKQNYPQPIKHSDPIQSTVRKVNSLCNSDAAPSINIPITRSWAGHSLASSLASSLTSPGSASPEAGGMTGVAAEPRNYSDGPPPDRNTRARSR